MGIFWSVPATSRGYRHAVASAQLTRTLTTPDGHVIIADVSHPEGEPVGGVVLCHPHPQFGGDRHNHVVDTLYRTLPVAGFRTVRFDFRADHDRGHGERLDVVTALDELVDGLGARPSAVVGYSFGASVALNTDDERIRSLVAIAPPLSMMPAPEPSVPVLVLAPEHDQFCPPDVARAAIDGWTSTELDVIESTDHSIAGRTTWVADRVAHWLSERS